MNFSIEPLTSKDEKNFLDFIKSQEKSDLKFFTRWNNSIKSEEDLKKLVTYECNLNPKNGFRIIAQTEDGKIFGFGLIDFFTELQKKHVAIVGTIVDKKMRKMSIGKKLLEKEIKIGKKYKKKKLRATVHEHNTSSMKLHFSLGFTVEGKFVAEEFDQDEFRNVMSLALFLN